MHFIFQMNTVKKYNFLEI